MPAPDEPSSVSLPLPTLPSRWFSPPPAHSRYCCSSASFFPSLKDDSVRSTQIESPTWEPIQGLGKLFFSSGWLIQYMISSKEQLSPVLYILFAQLFGFSFRFLSSRRLYALLAPAVQRETPPNKPATGPYLTSLRSPVDCHAELHPPPMQELAKLPILDPPAPSIFPPVTSEAVDPRPNDSILSPSPDFPSCPKQTPQSPPQTLPFRFPRFAPPLAPKMGPFTSR